MEEQDKKFLQVAIDNSKKMLDGPNEPFTAVLVDKDGNIVAAGQNEIVTQSDPSWHSEMALIRDFCHENKTTDLSGYSLYANGEPCAMCATLISWANINKLVYAVPTETINKIKGPKSAGFSLGSAETIAHGTNKVQVVGPLLENEARPVFEQWFEKNK